ncbi:MAG TPA: hypothetical protein VKI00_20870, partial [Mycobacterium sp.]|uniref:hypothetical protein n=1 Tax=Mycobacterium sp. TaxID=1785 RepID=UPI002B63ABB8
ESGSAQYPSVISELTTNPPRLAADSVIETEVADEIPREADQLDCDDEAQRDQGGKQSDGTPPGADRREGKDQKERSETKLHPHENPFGRLDRFVIVGEMAVGKTGQR